MLYKKGDWVKTRDTQQRMRVERDQLSEGPDRHLVWCEWEKPGYNLRAYFSADITRAAEAPEASL